jgi:hypothetical protein
MRINDTYSFIKKAKETPGHGHYGFHLTNYVVSSSETTFCCPFHGRFRMTPNRFLILKTPCRKCNGGKHERNVVKK